MMESSSCSTVSSSSYTYQGVVYSIPIETCSPFGTYPNPLGLTDDDRAQFHPVVQYPNTTTTKQQKENYKQKTDLVGIVGKNYLGISILDHTKPSKNKVEMATQAQRELVAQGKLVDDVPRVWQDYGIGRYDENRNHMYTSEMFDDTTNDIDGFDGIRTLHVGIDLDGPLYTPVHAFWYGTIHAIGYNPELGDYGHVIVVKHDDLPSSFSSTNNPLDNNNNSPNNNNNSRTVFALYGHLTDFDKVPTTISITSTSNSITTSRKVGDKIQRGDILGYMGNIHENGGWLIPHVHFQLALQPPITHDMPGAVAIQDRSRALILYPDPRYALGPLH